MLGRTNIAWFIVVFAVLIATSAMLGTAVAQKAAAPKPQDKLAIGENEVKQFAESAMHQWSIPVSCHPHG